MRKKKKEEFFLREAAPLILKISKTGEEFRKGISIFLNVLKKTGEKIYIDRLYENILIRFLSRAKSITGLEKVELLSKSAEEIKQVEKEYREFLEEGGKEYSPDFYYKFYDEIVGIVEKAKNEKDVKKKLADLERKIKKGKLR